MLSLTINMAMSQRLSLPHRSSQYLKTCQIHQLSCCKQPFANGRKEWTQRNATIPSWPSLILAMMMRLSIGHHTTRALSTFADNPGTYHQMDTSWEQYLLVHTGIISNCIVLPQKIVLYNNTLIACCCDSCCDADFGASTTQLLCIQGAVHTIFTTFHCVVTTSLFNKPKHFIESN